MIRIGRRRRSKQLTSVTFLVKSYPVFLDELSTSIDHVITETKPITLLRDNQTDFLNHYERECLDSIMVPDELVILNNAITTQIGGNSETLIDNVYQITWKPKICYLCFEYSFQN